MIVQTIIARLWNKYTWPTNLIAITYKIIPYTISKFIVQKLRIGIQLNFPFTVTYTTSPTTSRFS